MVGTRQQQKQQSRENILDAASKRLRQGGPEKLAIKNVMKSAGLTHGAFYAHFKNKDELATAAFEHAISTVQPNWFAAAYKESTFELRLANLAGSYLTPSHRDHPATGCAIAAIASELETASVALKKSYSDAVEKTIDQITDGYPLCRDEAIEFLASITGAIILARNTTDTDLSDRILSACAGRYVRAIDS